MYIKNYKLKLLYSNNSFQQSLDLLDFVFLDRREAERVSSLLAQFGFITTVYVDFDDLIETAE